MDRRNHVTDTKLLENIRSRNQVATREPSSTTLTSMVSMLMCITAMETIILEVVTEGMGVDTGEAAAMVEAAVTEEAAAMEEAAATEEAAAMEEVVEDMEVAVIMVMVATAVILNMMTAINGASFILFNTGSFQKFQIQYLLVL